MGEENQHASRLGEIGSSYRPNWVNHNFNYYLELPNNNYANLLNPIYKATRFSEKGKQVQALSPGA